MAAAGVLVLGLLGAVPRSAAQADVAAPRPPAPAPVAVPRAPAPAADTAASRAPAPVDTAVIEDTSRLAVTINGRHYALDALIARRPGSEKLPVVLIAHGSAVGDPRLVTIDRLRGWAHDFATRGWLAVAVMRRGYGLSEGDVMNDDGSCAAPEVGNYLDEHADDLEAALQVIAQRPDADMRRVLAIGNSTGGAAVMALGARAKFPLMAMINVSGGLERQLGPFQPLSACKLYESDLVWNFARFGTAAKQPTLWIYAENDSIFRPGLVGRMRTAYADVGGKAELVMLPPFGTDGHALFFTTAGRQLLLPEVDRFLRANGWPTWQESAFDPILARLNPESRQGVVTYLRAPAEKALVIGVNGRTYWHYADGTLEDARSKALAYCKQETKADCTLIAQDFDPVGAPPTPEQK